MCSTIWLVCLENQSRSIICQHYIFETALQLKKKKISFESAAVVMQWPNIKRNNIMTFKPQFFISNLQIIRNFNVRTYRWMKICTFRKATNMTVFLIAHLWQKGLSVIKSKKKERRKTWFLLTIIKWSLKMSFFYGSFPSWHAASVWLRSLSSKLPGMMSQVSISIMLLQMKAIWYSYSLRFKIVQFEPNTVIVVH